jgi:hypothetical protein
MNSHEAVVAIDRPEMVGEGRGETVVCEKLVDCVIKLDVSRDSDFTIGSLLRSLLFPSDIRPDNVIDILLPGVFVSYSNVVLVE